MRLTEDALSEEEIELKPEFGGDASPKKRGRPSKSLTQKPVPSS